MYITIAVIILIILFLFLNIGIRIYFCYAVRTFEVTVIVAGIKIKIKKIKKLKKKIKIYYNIVKYITEHIYVKYLKLKVLIGLDDALADVFAVQFLRNTLASVYSLFNNAFDSKTKLYVNIMPAFNQTVFNMNFDCIINVHVGYIIFAYIRHYKNILQNKLRRFFK